MELLSSVRKWLSSASSQSYDSISEQTPDSLLARAKTQEKPEKDPSVMAPIPSQNYIPPTEVRPFSEEIAATVREQYRKFQQPKEVVKLLSELAIDPTTYIPASKGIGITAPFSWKNRCKPGVPDWGFSSIWICDFSPFPS